MMRLLLVMTVMKNGDRRNGFTLIEVVVVMAVLAVLAILIIGAITIARKTAGRTKLVNDAKVIRDLLEAYHAKNKYYPKHPTASTYSRIDAYSLYAPTSTPTGRAGKSVNNELKDPISQPPYPTPPASGMVCYSSDGIDYWLWIVDADDWSQGISCSQIQDTATPPNVSQYGGFQNASIRIHCPKDQTCCTCESKYWY